MINTSPRTKILLDIRKSKGVEIKKYLKVYNTKKILDNRLARLKTNNEITDKNNFIKINHKGFKFLNIVIFIFYLLKKI
jgi:coproporphyrinogen III oxidase-like Fe-S oxidoreductase